MAQGPGQHKLQVSTLWLRRHALCRPAFSSAEGDLPADLACLQVARFWELLEL